MPNPVDPVQRHAEQTPHAVAIRGDQENWSYQQLMNAAAAFGAHLSTAGIGPGDRVVLIAPAVPEFVVAYLGIHAAGCVVVPMNPMSRSSEVDYVLGDSDAGRIIVWHEASTAAYDAAVARRIPIDELGTLHPDTSRGHGHTVHDLEPDATAAILYTSGTSGRPKGAELSVENILVSAEIAVEARATTTEDRFATALPLFHIYGYITVMMAALTAGASISLLSPFDPVHLLHLIRRDRITVVAGVPTMWNAILRASDGFGPEDLSTVAIAISGGASLPAEVWRGLTQTFECEVLEGYGLTETTSLATFSRPGKPVRIGSVGPAVPRTEIEIRADDGTTLPAGEPGEVWVRGPSVMKGYWRRPEATAEVMRDGWFRTGDIGVCDTDGGLRIMDRLKDLIIRGGYNVYPGEVEEVLYTHPDIVEAAVLGVPDDYYGEEVAALVVLRADSALAPEAVTEWARERLSPYKIPRIVHIVDALPKSATGKILKRSITIPIS
ncbi:AMP-binding protein [Gordonia sp. NPDC003376]